MKREVISRIFSHQPTLETSRLILRRLSVTDADDMYAYSRDPEVSRYLLWKPHPSPEYTRKYLQYIENRLAIGDFFDWAIVEKSSGRMIGTAGFTRFYYEHDCGEIGYVLSQECWGRGYATEAAGAVIRYGFDVLGLERIEARFIAGNADSLAVMQKLGMQLEGYMRNAMRVKGKMQTIGVAAVLRGESR